MKISIYLYYSLMEIYISKEYSKPDLFLKIESESRQKIFDALSPYLKKLDLDNDQYIQGIIVDTSPQSKEFVIYKTDRTYLEELEDRQGLIEFNPEIPIGILPKSDFNFNSQTKEH